MTYTRKPKLPPRGAILDAWLRGHPFSLTTSVEDREKEFEMWESSIKAQAWQEGCTAGLHTGLHIGETYMGIRPYPIPPAPTNPYTEEA